MPTDESLQVGVEVPHAIFATATFVLRLGCKGCRRSRKARHGAARPGLPRLIHFVLAPRRVGHAGRLDLPVLDLEREADSDAL